jgi:light-regulated signal transduction histidine kinase (bacteriophytochrome)
LHFDIDDNQAEINFAALPALPLDVSRIAMVLQNLIGNISNIAERNLRKLTSL